jgi:uncharacterized protein
MKYLVLLVVLVIAVGVWRSRREPAAPRRAAAGPQPAQLQDMVACAHCGLHLPHSDAVIQGGAHYCSVDHLRLGPAPHP